MQSIRCITSVSHAIDQLYYNGCPCDKCIWLSLFKFGGGHKVRAACAVLLPVGIGWDSVVVKIHVVPGDASILLSKPFLRYLQIVLYNDCDELCKRKYAVFSVCPKRLVDTLEFFCQISSRKFGSRFLSNNS